jgi:hypothetical protein
VTATSVPTATQEFAARQDTALRESFLMVGPVKIVHPARAGTHSDTVTRHTTVQGFNVEFMDSPRNA